MNQSPDRKPEPEEAWACLADTSEVYRVEFRTREEAISGLAGEPGAVVRLRRGFAREGLEYVFDAASILSRIEERAEVEGQVLAHFELGVFNTTEVQEDDLRRRLADALFGWIETQDITSWVILETEDVEAITNAKNPPA